MKVAPVVVEPSLNVVVENNKLSEAIIQNEGIFYFLQNRYGHTPV